MKTESYPLQVEGAEEKTSFALITKQWRETCNSCHPITPLICATDCKIWRQKNEFRMLYGKMKTSNFMTDMLNTIKNQRRLQILNAISKRRHSVAELQKELKKLGYYHSQQTIAKEYLSPLIEAGLAKESQNQHQATLFGCRLNEIVKGYPDLENILPPHSECYEEVVLDMLLNKPRVFKDFEDIVPTKSIARVLNRLEKAGLVEVPKENEYVYYLRTKRDANKAEFSPTEGKVYENIPTEGISARKLSEITKISLRRTYKYIRRLKGKKLVFSRKKPKFYTLSPKGVDVAEMLNNMHKLALETLATASQMMNNRETNEMLTSNNS